MTEPVKFVIQFNTQILIVEDREWRLDQFGTRLPKIFDHFFGFRNVEPRMVLITPTHKAPDCASVFLLLTLHDAAHYCWIIWVFLEKQKQEYDTQQSPKHILGTLRTVVCQLNSPSPRKQAPTPPAFPSSSHPTVPDGWYWVHLRSQKISFLPLYQYYQYVHRPKNLCI